VVDLLEPSIAVETPLSLSERRRPDRITTVSPALIPLLRGGTVSSPACEERRESDLAPAIGIAVSVLISGLIWALLLWII
jgi:hypothetical protein